MKFNQIKPELPERKCTDMNNLKYFIWSPQEMIYSFDKFQVTPADLSFITLIQV